MDIKKEPNFVTTKIKEEPDFILQHIKKEPGCVVKEIKKEFNAVEAEFPPGNLRNFPSNSTKSKQKVTKTHRKIKKVISRKKKRTSKSSKKCTQRKKVRRSNSSISKKSPRKAKTKSRRKGKAITKSVKCTGNKKETHTLLDEQSSTKLRLFGFRDELEYFPLESVQEGFKESNSGSDSIPKRTHLSRLDARKKVILSLKSVPTPSPAKRRCNFQPVADENVDLLGSLLDSQVLWHSKDSQIKVKDDGTVEIINEKYKNKSVDIKLTKSEKTYKMKDAGADEMFSTQKWSELQRTQLNIDQPVLFEPLNESKKLETHWTEINIKHEAYESSESQDSIIIIDSDEEEKAKQTIKIEVKEERNE